MANAAKFHQPLPTNAASFVDQAGANLRSAGDRILEGLVWLGEHSGAARKARQFQALNALNDKELAARGLTRDGLANYVFGPYHS